MHSKLKIYLVFLLLVNFILRYVSTQIDRIHTELNDVDEARDVS